MSQTKQRTENCICEGGPYDRTRFTYKTGSNTVIGYDGGYYLKTSRINQADLVVWIWKPTQPETD